MPGQLLSTKAQYVCRVHKYYKLVGFKKKQVRPTQMLSSFASNFWDPAEHTLIQKGDYLFIREITCFTRFVLFWAW